MSSSSEPKYISYRSLIREKQSIIDQLHYLEASGSMVDLVEINNLEDRLLEVRAHIDIILEKFHDRQRLVRILKNINMLNYDEEIPLEYQDDLFQVIGDLGWGWDSTLAHHMLANKEARIRIVNILDNMINFFLSQGLFVWYKQIIQKLTYYEKIIQKALRYRKVHNFSLHLELELIQSLGPTH